MLINLRRLCENPTVGVMHYKKYGDRTAKSCAEFGISMNIGNIHGNAVFGISMGFKKAIPSFSTLVYFRDDIFAKNS